MSKPSVVRSIRMSPDLWAYVAERAEKKDISLNAWLARFIEAHKAGKLVEVAKPK